MSELVYVDSNVFIYPVLYAKETDPQVKKAGEILQNIAKGELLAFTSSLTWDEVVWTVRKTMGASEALIQGQKLLGFINLQFIAVDEAIISQAQGLMSSYNLKPRDAIHVASAIDRRLKLIVSDDHDLDVVKEIKRVSLA